MDIYKFAEQLAQTMYGRNAYIIEPVQKPTQLLDIASPTFENKDAQYTYVGHVQWQGAKNTFINCITEIKGFPVTGANATIGIRPRVQTQRETTSADVHADTLQTTFCFFQGLNISHPNKLYNPGDWSFHWSFVGYRIFQSR